MGTEPWNGRGWRRNTAVGRWYGLGRWYAMFPPAFVRDAVLNLTEAGETVLDPFCGRGNGPFTAAVMGRPGVGIDIHPLAWLWTETKLNPEPDVEKVLSRLGAVERSIRPADRQAINEFENLAWAPEVRAFLHAARRELDWRHSTRDRTLMAFVALHMQDKRGAGLSNQMSPTVAYSPEYAVRWWTDAGLADPPDMDPVAFLQGRIERRYRHGIPQGAAGRALLGDAADTLNGLSQTGAALLLTSPPYVGVTDYWNDHWIRLWALGYDLRKDWARTARHLNASRYRELLAGAFGEARRHLRSDGSVLVRCDQRSSTAKACVEVLRAVWPRRRLFVRSTEAPHEGVSAEHGRGGSRAREIDLLMADEGYRAWWESRGFRPPPRAVSEV